MTRDDYEAFAIALGGVAVAMAESLTPERIDVYFADLADVPLAAVEAACAAARRTRTFFPKVAELRALAGCAPPDVGLVEALLCEHMRGIGNWRKPPEDPFLKLVVQRLGGYRAACEMPGSQRIFAIRALLPGAIVAATNCGIAMPNEATCTGLSAAAIGMAQRAIAAADGGGALYAEPPPGDTPDAGPRGNVVAIGDAIARKLGGAS
jgi:hypothetical protein